MKLFKSLLEIGLPADFDGFSSCVIKCGISMLLAVIDSCETLYECPYLMNPPDIIPESGTSESYLGILIAEFFPFVNYIDEFSFFSSLSFLMTFF